MFILQQNSIGSNGFFVRNTDLYIGADPVGAVEYQYGKLDDICIYNRALTDNEIRCLYLSQICSILDTIKICNGKSVTLPNGQTYSKDTIVYDILSSSYFCDSLVAWQVIVEDCPDTTTFSDTTCQNEFYTKHGFNIPASELQVAGTFEFRDTIFNPMGCDSIIILKLNVMLKDTFIINAAICDGETYSENGFNESISGTYTQNLQNQFGCDSIVILNLTVISPDDTLFLVASICAGERYTQNGFNETESGTYIQNLQNQFGYDSVVVLELTVNPIPEIEIIAISNDFCNQNYVILQVVTNGNSFLWNTGSSENPLTIKSSGIYSATAFIDDCKNKASYIVEDCSCEVWIPNTFTPNGDGHNEIFKPYISCSENIKEYKLNIYNRWGNIIFQSFDYSVGWDGRNDKGATYSEGVYHCVIEYTNAKNEKVLKHTSVTLLK